MNTDAKGSAPLKNNRRERFCQNILKGMTHNKAYHEAGYETKSERQTAAAAARMLTIVDIAERLSWLQSQLANENIATVQEVLELHTKAMRQRFAAASRFTNLTPDGDLSFDVDPDKLRNESAIKRVKVRVETSGRGDGKQDARFVEMEFHDYIEPAREIAKLKGLYAPEKMDAKVQHGGGIETVVHWHFNKVREETKGEDVPT